jgi:hypothetical protein
MRSRCRKRSNLCSADGGAEKRAVFCSAQLAQVVSKASRTAEKMREDLAICFPTGTRLPLDEARIGTLAFLRVRIARRETLQKKRRDVLA